MDSQTNQTPGLDVSQPSVEREVLPYMLHGSAPQHASQSTAPPIAVALEEDQVQALPLPPDDTEDTEIDKKWVEKAKEVVDQTQKDPRLQSSELAKVKAEYLNSRYGKVIKLAEDKKQ